MVSKGVKNKGGRPLKFKSVKELDEKIDAYFEDETNRPFTISGLAYFLGCDRSTIVNYSHNEKFFDTIKKARTKIESEVEKCALMGIYNPTFAIFNLKNNFGWKDKQEIDATTTDRVTIVNDLPSDEE